jgi:adenylate cyclase class IV
MELPDGSTQDFWMHVDHVEELGTFTEIKTHGTQTKQHWRELLALAAELGFSLADIAPESYLAMLLEQSS